MLVMLFGVLVGLSLGLTGGGGSVFAVPLLVYGLGLPMARAVPLSLLAVGSTALIGALAALPSRAIALRPALVFAAAGMLITPAGILLAAQLPQPLLLMWFALLALAIAAYMWWRARTRPEQAAVPRAGVAGRAAPVCRCSARCAAALALAGAVTGLLSGLFGVGGGFLIVPALMLVSQLSMRSAVATSLLSIAAISAAGVASALQQGVVFDWAVAAPFVAGGAIGIGAGFALARRLSGPVLQRGFALMIAATAMFMLGQPLWAPNLAMGA